MKNETCPCQHHYRFPGFGRWTSGVDPAGYGALGWAGLFLWGGSFCTQAVEKMARLVPRVSCGLLDRRIRTGFLLRHALLSRPEARGSLVDSGDGRPIVSLGLLSFRCLAGAVR